MSNNYTYTHCADITDSSYYRPIAVTTVSSKVLKIYNTQVITDLGSSRSTPPTFVYLALTPLFHMQNRPLVAYR